MFIFCPGSDSFATLQLLFLQKIAEACLVMNYEPVGIGIPPKITINSTIIIIPAIINGISKRKIAKMTIAMSAIINRVSDDPWKGSISTAMGVSIRQVIVYVCFLKNLSLLDIFVTSS
jgi:hypothetical protein